MRYNQILHIKAKASKALSLWSNKTLLNQTHQSLTSQKQQQELLL
jgi:hypothetical protein